MAQVEERVPPPLLAPCICLPLLELAPLSSVTLQIPIFICGMNPDRNGENGSPCLAHRVLELTQIQAWKCSSRKFECLGVPLRVPPPHSLMLPKLAGVVLWCLLYCISGLPVGLPPCHDFLFAGVLNSWWNSFDLSEPTNFLVAGCGQGNSVSMCFVLVFQ